ncbi:hypothetical protein MKW98_029306 [Papaver atlanticum]|uniref:Uncharacterized protein n=1 Tax=Papaver atlanticum TaxID=357466 RepID=A0AAD4XE64_9MAGN|nr:hypothetical protein MKW98_029306 [Papaver atlanticum]
MPNLVIFDLKILTNLTTELKSKENDIELYSKLRKEYFPAELFEGKKKVESNESKGFSSQNNDQLKFDDFIYREQKYEVENPDDDYNQQEDDNPDDDNTYDD